MADAPACGTPRGGASGGRRLLQIGAAACLAASLACRATSKDPPPPPASRPEATTAAAASRSWPPLPTTGFLSGRVATLRDAQEGNAVFVAESGGRALSTPLDIDVPQYAFLDEARTGRKTRVIVIQAERAAGTDTIGYLDLATGKKGVTTLAEIRLLGRTPPAE